MGKLYLEKILENIYIWIEVLPASPLTEIGAQVFGELAWGSDPRFETLKSILKSAKIVRAELGVSLFISPS